MMPFSEIFSQEGKANIEYKGESIYRNDNYTVIGKNKLKFSFISTNSKNDQCIVLSLYNFKGHIYEW